ncbi:MAG: hypothetical protein P4L41_10230 [Flavipsychrobacter sp.]|nr:hypothetical protein [Flavipsychrobacter sp.]
MKKTFKIVAITSVLCALAFSATLFSCKKVTDGIRVKVNTDIFTSPIGVHFVNYNTTSGTRPTDFSIKISGKDAALVYTSDGGSNYNVFGGFISLAVDKSAAPSPTHPVNFTITGSISGFAPIVYQVSITSDSAVSIVVPVIEYANPPANIVVLSTQVALTGNASPAKTLTPAATPTLANPATINIANGTTFKDASGNVISGNTLGVVATQYGTDSINSAQSIPGGLSPTDVLDINGSPIPGGVRFESAGSLAMQMNVDGVPVKSFGTPLMVNMPIDANLLNLATGNTVVAGDAIPVWSMDETTGQFKNEGNATVAFTGGKLVATFQVSHLSVWNLAWPSNPCPTPLHLTINTSDPNFSGGNYRIAIAAIQNGAAHIIGQPIVTSIYNGMTIDILNAPTNVQGAIIIYGSTSIGAFAAIATGTVFFCSTNSGTITVPVPSTIYVQSIFTGYCTDKQVTANLTGTISYASKTNALDFGSIYVHNGIAKFSIPANSTYTINAIDNGKTYTADVTFTRTNFKFPENSSITNGTAAYDANANLLSIAGQLNFSCK